MGVEAVGTAVVGGGSPPAMRTHYAVVRLGDLRPGESPRLNGMDHEHIRVLADLDEPLPPIVVRYADMSVVDGRHRLAAARLRGDQEIGVIFFHGSAEEAFRLAVEHNVVHGLPLSTADRRAAAERFIRANPGQSDRSLGHTTGLAAKTIAAIRRQVLDGDQRPARLGRDGRVRPLSTAEGRMLAGQVISECPEASLRDVARIAGISAGTVRDVRDRLRAGQDPVPLRQKADRKALAAGASGRPHRAAEEVDIDVLLDGLRCDPSLRYSETGRQFLRWLSARVPSAAAGGGLGRCLPPHSKVVVAKIARECARLWWELADEMDEVSEADA